MSLDDEEAAALARLPEENQWYFETGRLPEEQRDAALDAWCTIVAMEPRMVLPKVWLDSRAELHLEWSIDDGAETLDIVFEEDGVITWSAHSEELDVAMTNEHGHNPEHGYQLFLGRFKKKVVDAGAGRHARVTDGPGTGTHGFVIGHRAEDGYVILETRDRILIVKPEWIK